MRAGIKAPLLSGYDRIEQYRRENCRSCYKLHFCPMMKEVEGMISAEEFAKAGQKYLGRSYDDMDCQEFYERCAADCGLVIDLKGSNAWYRKFRSTGWVGSPEECKAKFGSVPKGATLFIHAFDGGEQKRGYYDGLGNASHIGIKTGTGKGAIHSSSSRGCVAESEFHDKTIRNGGWNTVGLSRLFDYGEKINRILSGGADPDDPADDPADPGEDEPMEQKAKVWSMNGGPVKMRQKPSESCNLYDELPFGTEVEVVKKGETWTQINGGTRTGWWIKTVFLVFGEVVPDDPDEDQDSGDDSQDDDVQPGDMVTIKIKAEDAVHLLTVMDLIEDQIVKQIGRG